MKCVPHGTATNAEREHRPKDGLARQQKGRARHNIEQPLRKRGVVMAHTLRANVQC